MNRIVLTGLIGSHPLGALASFGLLRVLNAHEPATRLLFVEHDDWIAAIDSPLESVDALLAFLQAWMSKRTPAVLAAFGDHDVRVEPDRFHDMIRQAIEDEVDTELLSFLFALAADGAIDKTKGLVKPSPFYMASGQQSFMETFHKIRDQVRIGTVWQEALLGPWAYRTHEWGAGWDPGTERMYALRHKAPTKEKTSCIAGAVWLAFEGLPLFPSFSDTGRVRTVGWLEHDHLDHWRWALPTVPTTFATLRVLVGSEDVGSSDVRRRSGVGAIYESTRHEFGQGYAVFRPARRLA